MDHSIWDWNCQIPSQELITKVTQLGLPIWEDMELHLLPLGFKVLTDLVNLGALSTPIQSFYGDHHTSFLLGLDLRDLFNLRHFQLGNLHLSHQIVEPGHGSCH